MMGFWRRLKIMLCLALAGAMLFTAACSKDGAGGAGPGKNDAAGPGRYAETDITPPVGGEFQTFLAEGDVIVCFSRGLETRCESRDGGQTWSESPGPGAGNSRYKDVLDGSMAPDGSLFVYIDGEGVFRIAPGGGEEKVQIKEIDDLIAAGESVMLSRLLALPSGRLLLTWFSGGNFIIQRDGPEGGGDPEAAGGAEADGAGDPEISGDGPVASEGSGGDTFSGTFSATTVGPGGRGGGPGDVRSVLYDTNGALVADFSNLGVGGAAASGDSLYLLDSQNNQILAYNLGDGKRKDEAARNVPSSGGGPGGGPVSRGGGPGGPGSGVRAGGSFIGGFGGGSMAVDAIGAIYLMSGSDLVRIDRDGSSDVALAGTSYATGTPRSNVDTVLPLKDGSILAAVRAQESFRLYKYVWDADAVLDPEKTLDVWSLYDSDYVRAVISAFRRSEPGVAVNYEVALSDDSGATANDAIKTLNTRLLGGSAPDVIILDGCPADSYASQGLLLDLAPLVDTGKMFQNLRAPFEKDGSLWYIPAQFKFPALLGQKDALKAAGSLEKLADIVVAGKERPEIMRIPGEGPTAIEESERPALYFEDLRDLFDIIWASSAAGVIRDGSLDTAALEEMLGSLKAISDKYALTEERTDGIRMHAMFSDGGGAMRVPDSAIWYASEQANYGALTVSSLPLLAMQSERPGSAMAAFPGLASDSFIPAELAGIAADSDSPDLAAGFIQTMLSYDVQSVGYGTGLPVTKEGLDGQIAAHNERVQESGRENVLDLDIVSLAESLKEPVLTDEALTGAVWAEAERLCMGETDIAKAVQNIEQNIKNYLAERA